MFSLATLLILELALSRLVHMKVPNLTEHSLLDPIHSELNANTPISTLATPTSMPTPTIKPTLTTLAALTTMATVATPTSKKRVKTSMKMSSLSRMF